MGKIVAIIPARKDSERLPHKNLKMMCGKPLINWTLDEALKCEFLDEILVSSNDPRILKACFRYFNYAGEKVKFIQRPKEISQAHSPVWKLVEHACSGYPDDTIIILLQITNPLKKASDIRKAYRLFEVANGQLGVVGAYYEFPSRFFRLNGSIFIQRLATIVNTRSFIHNGTIAYIMPKERSVDIDLQSDFDMAEGYLKEQLRNGER
jgi:CMP-N-acetylneuraminic acid synthetase